MDSHKGGEEIFSRERAYNFTKKCNTSKYSSLKYSPKNKFNDT